MKVVFHAGAQKTGSTSIQRWLYRNENGLNQLGITCPKRLIRSNQVDPIHQIVSRMRRIQNQDELKAKFKLRIAQLLDERDCHTVLLSNEDMFGYPIGSPNRAFYPTARMRVRTFSCFLNDNDLDFEFIFFIRAYSEFLQSYYVQYVRQGGPLSFESFCSQLDFEKISWMPIISVLSKSFPGKVKIVPFDHFYSRPGFHLNNLFFDGRFDPAVCDELLQIKANRSPSMRLVNSAQQINKILRQMTNMSQRDAGRFTSKYFMTPLELILKSKGSRMNSEISELLDIRYSTELKALENNKDVHLL